MKQSTTIQIRVSPEAKEKYRWHSERAKKGLSKLIKDMLDIELEKEKGNGTDSTDIEVLK